MLSTLRVEPVISIADGWFVTKTPTDISETKITYSRLSMCKWLID